MSLFGSYKAKKYANKVSPDEYTILNQLIKTKFCNDKNSNTAAKIVVPHKLINENLEYKLNKGPKHNFRTVKDGHGDCEDYSVVLASMYKALGLEPMIIRLKPAPTKDIGHLSTLVKAPRGRETIKKVREYYFQRFNEHWETISADDRGGELWLVSGSTHTNYVGDITKLENIGHIKRTNHNTWEWATLDWTIKP